MKHKLLHVKMSFGFSPSDILAVGNIALQLYKRFKSAVPQFNDLHDDLRSAGVVLNAIGQFCQTEENMGHLLSLEEQANLRSLVDACKTIFLELQKTLEENLRLRSQNPGMIPRLRWSQGSVEYNGRRLQSNLITLSTYTTPMMLRRSHDHASRQHEKWLQSIEGVRNDLVSRMSRTEELLASKIEEHRIPMPQDGQDHQVLSGYAQAFPATCFPDEAGRVSTNAEEAISHDLVRNISVLIPNESAPAEIVVSVLLRRALEESASEKVYAEEKQAPILNDTRPETKMLSIQLEKRVKRFCPESCPCSCHVTRRMESPKSLVPIFGRAFLRYCKIPQSTGPCNTRLCQNRIRAYARFTYFFPSWIMSRLVSVTFMGDPFMVVRTLRLVPAHSDSLRLCSLNEVERFRLLLDKRIASPLDASAWDGRSLLHIAVNTMALDSCRFLIEQGAPFDFEDQNGVTPSDMAWIKILGKQGSEESLDVLKSLFLDDDPFVTFNFSEAHKAVFGIGGRGSESLRSFEVVNVNDPDSFGITALSWAARRGDDKSLTRLLGRGADPNICDFWGMAPIHFASNLSDPNSVQQLVCYSADVNKADRWGRNALHYMTKTCSDSAFLEPIIRARIDINHLEYWGKPPLHFATMLNNHQAIKYLLENGAKTTYLDADDDSVVFEAVYYNSHGVLKILLDAKSDVTTINRWGYTILHMAAIYGDETTMDILNDIELNGNFLSIRSKDGLTPAEAFDKRGGRSKSLDEAFRRLQMSHMEAVTVAE